MNDIKIWLQVVFACTLVGSLAACDDSHESLTAEEREAASHYIEELDKVIKTFKDDSFARLEKTSGSFSRYKSENIDAASLVTRDKRQIVDLVGRAKMPASRLDIEVDSDLFEVLSPAHLAPCLEGIKCAQVKVRNVHSKPILNAIYNFTIVQVDNDSVRFAVSDTHRNNIPQPLNPGQTREFSLSLLVGDSWDWEKESYIMMWIDPYKDISVFTHEVRAAMSDTANHITSYTKTEKSRNTTVFNLSEQQIEANKTVVRDFENEMLRLAQFLVPLDLAAKVVNESPALTEYLIKGGYDNREACAQSSAIADFINTLRYANIAPPDNLNTMMADFSMSSCMDNWGF